MKRRKTGKPDNKSSAHKDKSMLRQIFFTIMFAAILCSVGYAQDTQKVISQVAEVYGISGSSGDGTTIAGYSIWGLVGGLLFGSVGFIAFVYGKKNELLKPLFIGILLMVYPYFLKSTLALYTIGIGLSVSLYFFRE